MSFISYKSVLIHLDCEEFFSHWCTIDCCRLTFDITKLFTGIIVLQDNDEIANGDPDNLKSNRNPPSSLPSPTPPHPHTHTSSPFQCWCYKEQYIYNAFPKGDQA